MPPSPASTTSSAEPARKPDTSRTLVVEDDPEAGLMAPGEGSGFRGIVAEHDGALRGDNWPGRRGAVFIAEPPAGENG